jgi:vitamin B12 transporter
LSIFEIGLMNLETLLKISLLAIYAIITTFYSPLTAQNDTIVLSDIEVSTSRVPQLYSETSRIVTVIGSDEIAKMPYSNISDVLEYAFGIDVRNRGGQNVQTDIGMRGGTFEQTQILLNGTKMNDPQTGHHSMNLPIDIGDIERIEILYGPGSRVYGSNAYSGAINIITKNDSKNGIRIGSSGGQHNLFSGNIAINGGFGNFRNTLSFSHQQCDGYIENTDYNTNNLLYKAGISTNKIKLSLNAGYQNKAFGANSFYTAVFPNQFEQVKTLFCNVSAETKGRIKLKPSVFWRRHSDRFELFRDNPPSWYGGHNYHLTNVAGFELNSHFTSAAGKSAVGIELRNENIKSNKLGEFVIDPIEIKGVENLFYIKSQERNHISFFADHIINISNKLSASLGIMTHWNQIYMWGLYPGIDISYNFVGNTKWYASINRSMRLPSFTELYYNDPSNKGNPMLKPENDISYETGIKQNGKTFSFHVAGFIRDGKNVIDWVRHPDSSFYTSENISEIRILGFESGTQLKINEIFEKQTFFQSLQLSYAYNTETKNTFDYISKYALDYLKHKLTAQLTMKLYKNIYISSNFVWQDREGSFYHVANAKETDYAPFYIIDSRIYLKANKFRIYLEANNLFNSKYYDFGNVEMPGRWLKVGFSSDLSFGKS